MRRTAARDQPWEGRAILHVDLDAFFAAVEQLDHPEWRGKPVIVGGDPQRRGVVSTCSYEARAFGVRSAMSSARAAQLCPNAIWTHGSFERYREMSAAVRAIFADEIAARAAGLDRRGVSRRHPGRFTVRAPRRDRATHSRTSRRARRHVLGGCLGSQVRGQDRERSRQARRADGGVPRRGGGVSRAAARPRDAGNRSADRRAARRASGSGRSATLAALDDVTAVRGARQSRRRSRRSRARAGRARASTTTRPSSRSPTSGPSRPTCARPDEVDGALAALAAKVGQRLRRKGLAGRTVTVKLRFSDFTTKTVRRTLPIAHRRRGRLRRRRRELLRSARGRPESACACSASASRASTTRPCSSTCFGEAERHCRCRCSRAGGPRARTLVSRARRGAREVRRRRRAVRPRVEGAATLDRHADWRRCRTSRDAD